MSTLNPTTLKAAGWKLYDVQDVIHCYQKTADKKLMNIAVTAGCCDPFSHDPVDSQWLISMTTILTVNLMECKDKTKLEIVVPHAMTIAQFNAILDGVNLPKFKIQTI